MWGKAKVFLSYAHEDASYAQPMIKFIQEFAVMKNAFRLWVDSDSISAGANWQQEIETGIRSCDIFLLIVSEAHFSTYVAMEIGSALGQRKPIIPLYIDSPQALVPYHLGHLQGRLLPPDFSSDMMGYLNIAIEMEKLKNAL